MNTIQPRKIRRYGWKPSLPRLGVVRFAPQLSSDNLPRQVDLRGVNMPPVYDQWELGSCTANAIAAAFDFQRKTEGLDFLTPSRLFLYYNERVLIEGQDPGTDGGAQIADGMKSVCVQGLCAESSWPYGDFWTSYTLKFQDKPSDSCYTEALTHTGLQEQSVDQQGIIAALASGKPVVGGFTVYSSFESPAVAASGIVPMPDLTTDQVEGGHAILIVGYDLDAGVFIVRNSWGTGWGQSGYFTIPIAYLTNPSLASDFWVFQKVN